MTTLRIYLGMATLVFTCCVMLQGQPSPVMSVQLLEDQRVLLSWPEAAANFVLEECQELSSAPPWFPNPTPPTLVGGRYQVMVIAGKANAFFRLRSSSGAELPPDPVTVASSLDQTTFTDLGTATAFLYAGSYPIQSGVTNGTIESRRAAVLRGRVLTREGQALEGVRVVILDHPEFGYTVSRHDGRFDLAVNGGGLLVVDYQKTGFLPAQRQVNVPWQDYLELPDVALVSLDARVTAINLGSSAPVQVARGGSSGDADGSRQATLLFPQGTEASILKADGSTEKLTQLNVRPRNWGHVLAIGVRSKYLIIEALVKGPWGTPNG